MILRGERVFRRVPLGVYDSASGGLDWSPDGRRRAYGSSWGDSSSLWLVRIEDGSRSRLTGGGETSDINPVWSPDGSKIYYEHGGGLLNWEGKGDRWLDTVTISPDGTKIAYLLGERGAWKNWSLVGVMYADGSRKTPFPDST